MKKQILVLMLAGTAALNTLAQNNADVEKITETVMRFAKGGDAQNTEILNAVLDAQFRAAVNRAFGSEELQVIDKNTYIQLIKDNKIGGDDRTVTIQSISIEGNIAAVYATLDGKKLNFRNFISLVKTAENEWKIIQDMPSITAE